MSFLKVVTVVLDAVEALVPANKNAPAGPFTPWRDIHAADDRSSIAYRATLPDSALNESERAERKRP